MDTKDIYLVSIVLRKRYNNFPHYNLKNPLDELLFILCSVMTPEGSYRGIFRKLKQKYPTFDSLKRVRARDMASIIKKGGLSNQKTIAIKKIVETIRLRFGRVTLSPLKKMGDHDVEEFLTSLPRVGVKVARCVMMYSLDREVFPVDTHIWRIVRRLGWVRPTNKEKSCRRNDMDRLQGKIPPDLRFSLHVNMISLGREICLANRPKCEVCPIEKHCKKYGVGVG
ncbi:MAG: hypothetical protein OXM00_09540 [Paracoccaceae bacterium]|nr:hypothetical protein [Paracoccaceae bacterium]